MTVDQAITHLEALQGALSSLLAEFAAADPDPAEIERLNAVIADSQAPLDQVDPSPADLPRLLAAARETDRLAQAAAAAAASRRAELTEEQAQSQRSFSALGSYRASPGASAAQFLDRRS
jgi:hypothetical protein